MSAHSPAVLVAANRAATVETVLRWMIHDFRNPLQALAFLPVLTETAGGDSEGSGTIGSDAFATACERLTTSLALVERLVGLASRSGAPEPVALGEVLQFLAELFSARRGRFRVEVEAARRLSLPAVSVVRPSLEAALLNLMLNAAEAAGQGAVTLTATASARPGGVELVLQDGGPGVPESLRPWLFEPFATSLSDRPTRGLGLYAARHLLAQGGGDIRYEAASPGSRFIVSLPEWRA
ncbi:MAG: HAMP domain-containing sensor histidine kinase [Gemmatimonadales bacterium]